MGHSAGAHLALYSVAEATVFREMDLQSSSIRALIGISGVYNIARMANVTFYGSLVVQGFLNSALHFKLVLICVCSDSTSVR